VFVVAVDRAYAAHRQPTSSSISARPRNVLGGLNRRGPHQSVPQKYQTVSLENSDRRSEAYRSPVIDDWRLRPIDPVPCGAARNAQLGKRHSLRPVSLWIGDSESSREFPRPNTVESRCTLPLVYGGSQVSNSGSVGPRNSSRRLRFLLPARAHSRRCVANYVYCEALRQKFSPARNKRGR
jgi:hypothetical protein